MMLVGDDKKQSELVVITKAKDLCSYVMEATQKSPKQFRFSYVNRLQNLALSAIEGIIRANDLLVGGKHGTRNVQRRYDYQMQAITDIKLLAYFSEVALQQHCILDRQYEQIARLSTDCRHLLGAWINSDRKRLSPAGA
jgi:hypothetical protein